MILNGTGRDVQFLWIQHSFQKSCAGLFEMGFDPLGWLNFIDPRRSYIATAFMIPPVRSSVAPNAFGESETGDGVGWRITKGR